MGKDDNELIHVENCKYGECGFVGQMAYYVGFFPQAKITEAHGKDGTMPKYGFHLGYECPKCGRWQKFVRQDEKMLGRKFYSVKCPAVKDETL